MDVIRFEAHLLELDDLNSVHDHILEHEPCIAFYTIHYPQGNKGYFCAAAHGKELEVSAVGVRMIDIVGLSP